MSEIEHYIKACREFMAALDKVTPPGEYTYAESRIDECYRYVESFCETFDSTLEEIWKAKYNGRPGWYGMHKVILNALGVNKLPENKESLHVDVMSDENDARFVAVIGPFVRGSRKQRVRVRCSGCGQMVVIGRINQHKCRR